ncbi:hypothetical protein N431DRAFT_514697 [Stipitochalara longipes BDJ]|nr:hypothetical protein N431DRAFT_514697 [Stipitochalara longipes BDJ]
MSASTQQPRLSDSLALVNSFYGPGATACWYLTWFSSLITKTIHPTKRTVDDITSDVIAIVTFPAVASAHMLTQIQIWPSETSLNAPGIFERTFIIDSLALLILILISASILVGLLLVYLCVLFSRSWPKPVAVPLSTENIENQARGLKTDHDYVLPHYTTYLLYLSRFIERNPIWTERWSFFDDFFPKTEANIMDLDQVVALLAGMTVLGFSLYSAADARYKRWWISRNGD